MGKCSKAACKHQTSESATRHDSTPDFAQGLQESNCWIGSNKKVPAFKSTDRNGQTHAPCFALLVGVPEWRAGVKTHPPPVRDGVSCSAIHFSLHMMGGGVCVELSKVHAGEIIDDDIGDDTARPDDPAVVIGAG